MEIKGIDVSSNQGKPDWPKVAKSGVKFAILRIHQRSGVDSSFEYNYKGCKSNGILIGGYKYSYALTPAQAIDEAEDVIAALNGRGLDFPVFYDLEWFNQLKLGKQAIENKPGAPLKCLRPGNCPGQVKNNMQFKKDKCEYILIGNCSDCSNTVMASGPKMGLKVFHQTDHVMRTVGHPLYRSLKVSKEVSQEIDF